MMGIGYIMDFVYRGYTAFQTLSDIEPFIETLRRRERAFNKSMFGIETGRSTP